MASLLPYLLGWAVLVVMLFAAGVDDGRRQVRRETERKRRQREITDLECWIEIADRKSAAQAEREKPRRDARDEYPFFAAELKAQWTDVDLKKQLYETEQKERLVREDYLTQEQMDAHKPIRQPPSMYRGL